MGFWKNLFAGAVALKVHNALKRPTVVAPEGFTIVGLEQKGIRPEWSVYYIENSRPNVKRLFSISPSTSAMNSGGNKFRVFWPR
jgi:hypothetical protein